MSSLRRVPGSPPTPQGRGSGAAVGQHDPASASQVHSFHNYIQNLYHHFDYLLRVYIFATITILSLLFMYGIPLLIAYIVYYRWGRGQTHISEGVQHVPEPPAQTVDVDTNPWDDYDPDAYGKDNPRSVTWGKRRLSGRNQISSQEPTTLWGRPPGRPLSPPPRAWRRL